MLFRIFSEKSLSSRKVRKMAQNVQSLTLLENELIQKVNFLKPFLYEPTYYPKRVEPYVKTDLKESSNWSKFSGETLFINQNILKDKHLREGIFWRESFLLFAPKKSRNVWWLQLLANVFPLAIKMDSKSNNSWKQLVKKQLKKYQPLYDLLKLIIAASGIDGFLQAFNKVLYFEFSKEHAKENSGRKRKSQRRILKPDEFKIILTEIYYSVVKITKNTVDIMQKALLRQTIKPKILAQYSTKHLTTISKTIKQLLAMRILRRNFFVNLAALGLTQYIVLLFSARKGFNFFNTVPQIPFLVSQKKNCLANCIITQLYTAPKSPQFFQYLNNYCEDLLERGFIYDFYLFEVLNSKRYYSFKYFNPKSKKHQLNFNMLVIESGLFQSELPSKILNLPPPETIIIPSKVFKSRLKAVNLLELQIINQFLQGIETSRGIQKAVNKDMNKVVECIKRLHKEQLIFENVVVVLPSSPCEMVIYFEKEKQPKRETYRTFDDRLNHFFTFLPNAYLGEVRGSFQGYLAQTFLQHSTILEMADFLTSFYPEDLKFQLVIGRSIFQKYDLTLPINRWLNGEWLFSADDFKL